MLGVSVVDECDMRIEEVNFCSSRDYHRVFLLSNLPMEQFLALVGFQVEAWIS
jgi:hypothetical protein